MPKKRGVYLFVSDGELLDSFVTKDVGAVPYMFHQYFSYDVTFICNGNESEFPSIDKYLPNVKIEIISSYTEENVKNYINAYYEKMDLVILSGAYFDKFWFIAYTYKKLRPNGKIYLSTDANSHWMDSMTSFNPLMQPFLSKCDVIGVSGRKMTRHLSKKWPYVVDYIPNGFFNFAKCDMTVDFDKKENILLTVGRIGAHQKHNELLLNAFAAVKDEISDWRLHLVGGIEEDFYKFIEDYFSRFPDLKERVIFKGRVNDKQELLAEYKRAKIFVLTSRFEGAPNVAAEALFSGCYTITTDIDAAGDITHDGRCGQSFPIEDQGALEQILKNACHNEDLLLAGQKKALKFAKQNYGYEKIIKRLHFLLFGREDEEEKLGESVYAVDIYGNKRNLLPLFNYYENRSDLPLTYLDKSVEGGRWTCPLRDLVNAIDSGFQNAPNSGIYRNVVIMTMRELIRKQRSYNFLIIGDAPDNFILNLSEILDVFSGESKIFVLSENIPEESPNNVYFCKNFQSDFEINFDFLFVDNHNGTLTSAKINESVKFLRPYGTFFFAGAKFEPFFELFDESIILPVERGFLLKGRFTLLARKCFKIGDEKLDTQNKKKFVKYIVKTLKTKIKAGSVSKKDILKLMDAERIIAEIYPSLTTEDIKYRINELKEALIEKGAMRKKLKSLLGEMNLYNDF